MKTPPRVYDTVVLSGEPNATVYRVIEIEVAGQVHIVNAVEPASVQKVSRGILERATVAQLQNAGLI